MGKIKNSETPRFKGTAFKCPHCRNIEAQTWEGPRRIHHKNDGMIYDLWYSTCEKCNGRMIRVESYYIPSYGSKANQKSKVIFPINYNGEYDFEISKDMPIIIEDDFKEAIQILPFSPRGACAILRLCLQKFLDEIIIKITENKKDSIDESIKYLSNDIGIISDEISNIMHILRIIGNEAVHPGQIDLTDDYETAERLIELFNYLINEIITENKKRIALYNKIPINKKSAIKDNKIIEKILTIETIDPEDNTKFEKGAPIQDNKRGML